MPLVSDKLHKHLNNQLNVVTFNQYYYNIILSSKLQEKSINKNTNVYI